MLTMVARMKIIDCDFQDNEPWKWEHAINYCSFSGRILDDYLYLSMNVLFGFSSASQNMTKK